MASEYFEFRESTCCLRGIANEGNKRFVFFFLFFSFLFSSERFMFNVALKKDWLVKKLENTDYECYPYDNRI